MAMLQMAYKIYREDVSPEYIQEETLTFVLTPHQVAGLLRDLTQPLLDFLPADDDE